MLSFGKGREHENIGQNTHKLTKLESDYILNNLIANFYMHTHFHSLAKGFIKLLTCINKTYFQQFFNRERHISTELTNPLANSKCVIYRTMVFR